MHYFLLYSTKKYIGTIDKIAMLISRYPMQLWVWLTGRDNFAAAQFVYDIGALLWTVRDLYRSLSGDRWLNILFAFIWVGAGTRWTFQMRSWRKQVTINDGQIDIRIPAEYIHRTLNVRIIFLFCIPIFAIPPFTVLRTSDLIGVLLVIWAYYASTCFVIGSGKNVFSRAAGKTKTLVSKAREALLPPMPIPIPVSS